MKSRKQRKLEAKQNGVAFVPQYNGTGVLSFEDYYGVGNERFDNKFVRISPPTEDEINKMHDLSLRHKDIAVDNSKIEDVIDSDGLPWKEYEPSTEEKVEDVITNDSELVDVDDMNNRLEVYGEINAREINVNDETVLEDKPNKKKAKKESKWKKKIKKLFNK